MTLVDSNRTALESVFGLSRGTVSLSRVRVRQHIQFTVIAIFILKWAEFKHRYQYGPRGICLKTHSCPGKNFCRNAAAQKHTLSSSGFHYRHLTGGIVVSVSSLLDLLSPVTHHPQQVRRVQRGYSP
jgi:hypothetical protein